MPDKVIDIPGHGQIAFPDTMSDAQINAAATKLYQEANPRKKQPPVKSWMDTAMDWLPAVGGAVGGVVGGIGGTVAGMGVGGVPGAIGGATLGGATGEAAKELINRARGAAAPKSPSEAAGQIATQAGIQGASEAGGAVVGGAMRAAAPRLMQAAVKPTLAMLKGMVKGEAVPRVVQTLLDEGVNVSPAGVQRLQELLTQQRGQISQAIGTAAATGAEISPYRVASRLSDTARTFANQVTPESDLAAIGDVGNQFLDRYGGKNLPLDAAQSIKQGTYAQLRKKYGELGSAATEAQKALARGLKEELEGAVPGVGAMNAREGQLTEAAGAVGKRVALSGNKDPVGFAWVTQNPAVFLAAMMDRSPAVKSMIARGMYQSAGAAAKVAPQLIRAAVVALTTSDSGGGPSPE